MYDRIELITPDKHDELMADLCKRTGLNIEKIEIGHIDFLRDAAFIRVYYPGGTETSNTALNNITKLKPEL